MAAGIRNDVERIDPSNVTDRLQSEYLPLETGIAPAPGGGLSVAILTNWPGATPAMIEWWFARDNVPGHHT